MRADFYVFEAVVVAVAAAATIVVAVVVLNLHPLAVNISGPKLSCIQRFKRFLAMDEKEGQCNHFSHGTSSSH